MDAETARVEVRACTPEDHDHVIRMWREVQWIDDSDRMADALRTFLGYGDAQVAVLDGEAEALVHRTPGTIRYEDQDLSLSAVTAVTTSPVGRNLGLATLMTSAAVAAAGAEGAAVAALGMFEQGFYDRVGFGSLGYTLQLVFDPGRLQVEVPAARPVRVRREDWRDLAALLARGHRSHGGVRLSPPEAIQAELAWFEDPYLGLGFRAEDGRLRAAMVGTNASEYGPYRIALIAYETLEDLRDLLGLLRSLSAQIHRVALVEPAGVQVQDLLDRPLRGSELLDLDRQPPHTLMAWAQLRILDLETCAAARRWPGEPVSFDLVLHDPLTGGDHPWPGLGGDHSITVGDPSSAVPGHRGGLPVLRAGIGAFSRLWFGVRPASGLAVTDDLDGPPELLAALDRALLLPPPVTGLAF
ncbi:MAG: GNAT family N-acetyltransferase [Actinomycetota bacterium]